jgi:hypothetical protein
MLIARTAAATDSRQFAGKRHELESARFANGEPDRSDDELAIRHAALDYDDNDYLVMTSLTRNAL